MKKILIIVCLLGAATAFAGDGYIPYDGHTGSSYRGSGQEYNDEMILYNQQEILENQRMQEYDRAARERSRGIEADRRARQYEYDHRYDGIADLLD